VIEATNSHQLKQALTQLAGGIAQPLEKLREDLANLLADVEAGLDFTHEDIKLVDEAEMLKRLAAALAHLKLLQRQLERRSVESAQFRVVLAGLPNAGKSSLFNILAGDTEALVSPQPGTTRDYLVRRLTLEDVQIELIDTAGWQASSDSIEEQAQSLAGTQVTSADLVIVCAEAGTPDPEPMTYSGRNAAPAFFPVATKCDLRPGPIGRLATSARTRQGIEELQQILIERARQHISSAVAPSISRCRHHIEACLRHLRQAHDSVLNQELPEMLAVDLRAALEHLGEMTGAVYTDELLDRIFSRFCIGK
jgi:tRNA modification GTPase